MADTDRELIWDEAAKISELVVESIDASDRGTLVPWDLMSAEQYRKIVEAAFAILRQAIKSELRFQD